MRYLNVNFFFFFTRPIIIAMTSDRLSFASVEIDKSIRWKGGKACVTGGHVTSRNQGLSPNDKCGKGETLGTRLVEEGGKTRLQCPSCGQRSRS